MDKETTCNAQQKIHNKEMKEKYKQVFSLVKEAIDEWDPYGLIEGGAPDGEFNNEVEQIVPFVIKSNNADELAKNTKRIFDTMFEPVFKIEDCKKVAKKIIKRVRRKPAENPRKKLKVISIILIAAYTLINTYFVYALAINMVKWLQQPALTNAITGARSRPMGFFIEFWLFFGAALAVNLVIVLLYIFIRKAIRKKTINSPQRRGGDVADGVVFSQECGVWGAYSGVEDYLCEERSDEAS